MPSKEDWKELIEKCKWTKEKAFHVNGYRVEGMQDITGQVRWRKTTESVLSTIILMEKNIMILLVQEIMSIVVELLGRYVIKKILINTHHTIVLLDGNKYFTITFLTTTPPFYTRWWGCCCLYGIS